MSSTTISSSSKKRKRKNNIKIPNSIFQNESLELVASISGPIATAPITTVDKDILLERFKIELLDRCNFFARPSSSGTTKQEGMELSLEERRSEILHQCLIVGTNECTRALEMSMNKRSAKSPSSSVEKSSQSHLKPSLIMLARDLRPPTILAHIPFLCKQMDIPIVLLPGKASSDLGKLMKRKRAAIVLFCIHDESYQGSCNKVEKDVMNRIESFIKFARSKIPTSLGGKI